MEKLQFQVLYNEFILRVIDPELLSVQGDPVKLIGQFATILLTFSFVVSIPLVFAGLGGTRRMSPEAGWTFEHFLIATTMVTVGLFSVLSWDSVFPERRDLLVLAPLPISTSTLFLAKLAALGAGLVISIAALNGVSGLFYPLLFTPEHGHFYSIFRSIGAYWLTIVAASVFIFGAVLTVQGISSQLLPRQWFLKISALLQVMTFCLVLSVYILEPSLETHAALIAPENQKLLSSLPTYWFLGLFQLLNGSMDPAFTRLVQHAWGGLTVAVLGTISSVALSYFRTLRRIVEEPDISPGSRRSYWSPRGTEIQSGVLLFSLRTLLRSRQHRLILSLYVGVGFAITLILLKYSHGNEAKTAEACLAVSILMMCIAVAGIGTVFSMPIMLRANWLFRVAALDQVAIYCNAVRTTILLLSVVPIWVCCAALFLSIWPGKPAMAHLMALGSLGSILADVSIYGSHKLPFTCSYQPGKANIQFAFWGFIGLLVFTRWLAADEWETLHGAAGRITIAITSSLFALAVRWCTARSAKSADSMQFEDIEDSQIISLALPRDGALLRNGL